MEVSSQGLMCVWTGWQASTMISACLQTSLRTDIGPGEHASFEEYRSCKGQLFRRCTVGIVNSDDPNTEALLEGHTCRLVRYGRGETGRLQSGQLPAAAHP